MPADRKTSIFERSIAESRGADLFLVREILAITGISIEETGIAGSSARFQIIVPAEIFRAAGSAG